MNAAWPRQMTNCPAAGQERFSQLADLIDGVDVLNRPANTPSTGIGNSVALD